MGCRVLTVIPARLGSKRFSDKVIYPFNGKPLLSYVYREICKAKQVGRVVIATDSDKIVAVAEEFQAEVIKTSSRHLTGSDRVAEVARKLGGDIIVNVQADNLGLKGAVLDRFIRKMKDNHRIRYATMARRVSSDDELYSPDLVKVIVDKENRALWFSRYPLPYLQRPKKGARVAQFAYLGHIGVYGFRSRALKEFSSWKRTPLEKAESLEQLRILEHGRSIQVFKTTMDSVEINSPTDVRKLRRIYR